jgi:peptidoglycan/xylan/chitin deacetylase (PgdA/CDA1 family)
MTVLSPTFARALGAALSICLSCPCPARALEGYAAEVKTGLSFLRNGKPPLAVQSFAGAIRLDANEPSAWIAWGTALLHTHNIKAARNCFARAAKLDPESTHAPMGLALCDLAEGQIGSARSRLATLHTSSPARRIVAYLDTVAGQETPVDGNAPLDRAVLAVRAARAGKTADSITAWRSLLDPPNALQPPHWPITATFDARKPIALRWSPNPTLPRPPSVPTESLRGSVLLRAATAPGVNQAFFDVDGVPAGMTNVPPYSFTWNTAEWPDGRHLLRITSTRAPDSSVIRERWVLTANDQKTPPHHYTELADIGGMLDEALTVAPDTRQAHYELAKVSLASGSAEARDHLEAIVAEDPAYRDAAHLLRALPVKNAPAEIWRGDRTRKRIALTFDDGPNARHTPGLLDVLDRLKAPATFFVVGKQAIVYPNLVRRMAAAGHEVENHTWNHVNLTRTSEAQTLRELAATKRLIARLTGRPTRYFRPPGGNIGPEAHRAAHALDLQAVMWTFASGKSEGLPVDDMAPRFVRAAKPGAIYLIHNGTDKMETLVVQVVKALRARGYEFVRLDDLLNPRD